MDLKQLYTFRTVATLGSFNKAADLLDYAQSTVSEQIKVLEADLDVKLFNRDGKHISLTPAGELFLQYAQKMINLEEEIRTEIKGCEEVYGSLSIRIPETISTYYLPPILKIFQSRFPHVDFHFNSCSYYGLHEELLSGIINLAFLITKNFRNSDLETHTLIEVPLVLITYPDNPIAAKPCVRLIELKNEPIFVTSSDCNYFKILEKLFTDKKIKLSTLYHINSIEAIKQNITAGTGVALLPKIAVHEEISKGLLVELPFEKGPLSADMVMIRLKNKWHPPILEAFMDIMKETLSTATGTTKSSIH
jgi:DNA-binding transcriptional LysR family regulator